ncbi:50S ribosomal protein L11 methyltransferase [Methylobrevis pamukkalensis]|uniref:Ribosomal protein L11 methyltransferase n=1 Tax=Methylobrevis pamukkalensis TaxID=1439726 RepID=A0A1E3GZ75_9HYPH|nr:50S ribosomal protein L11 methyltransferase [Methylobrevis pamukkalensis]ODN69235.1 Ribosomal protein L11 methyltransferase [Methylobrevis pamukkalensis]
MPQIHARLLAGPAEAERIAALLEAALGEDVPVAWSEIGDPAEIGTDRDALWAVDAYFDDGDPAEIEARIKDILGGDGFAAPMTVEALADIDWVSESLKGLAPVVAGRFVVHGAHDRDKLPAGAIGLEIEANQAFGTGHHPTTWGCLVALSRLVRRRRFAAVLDLGTGSGVLAIAYAKLTGNAVLASDIDPVSTRIAVENAALNGVGRKVEGVTAEGFRHPRLAAGRFDLVLANILAGPLKRLAPEIRARAMPGATVVLSGLLASQAAEVDAAFRAQGFRREAAFVREGWATLVLSLRAHRPTPWWAD